LTRPLEKHLDDAEIDRLLLPSLAPAQVSVLPQAAVRELQLHVESCGDCSRKVQMHRRAQNEILRAGSVRGVSVSLNCPGSVDWLQVASGMMSESETIELVNHAARCDHCGPMLRQASEFLSDETTDEEDRALEGFRGSQPGRQRKIAKTLRSTMREASQDRWTTWWNRGRFQLRSAFAGVAFALLFISAWIGLSKLQVSSLRGTEKLLAQAYTEQRTLELRFPDAGHSDFHQRRTGDVESLLSAPESLFKATDRIASALQKNPNDSHWLLLSARLDLLDWRYRAAFATLEKVEINDADVRLTRALALYEKAEMEQDPQSYGEIVEIMGKTLQVTPDDPTALFNQAVACEKLRMYECATKDYERLLKVEKESGWATEARNRLNRIMEKKTLEH
jgi:tetratricopeptide (TPR) repeat protein